MRDPIRSSHHKAALLTAVIVFLGACGGGGNDDQEAGVASLDGEPSSSALANGASPSGAEEAEAPEDPEDAFALFGDCMDEAGFAFQTMSSRVGGVAIESLGDERSESLPPPALSVDDFDLEEFEEAEKECRAHLVNVDTAFDMTPEQQAAFEDAQLEWSKCMDDQGVEVPDFEPGSGSIAITSGESSPDADPQAGMSFGDSNFDFEAFQEAAETCRYVYEQNEQLEGMFAGSPAE